MSRLTNQSKIGCVKISIALKAAIYISLNCMAFFPVYPIARIVKPSLVISYIGLDSPFASLYSTSSKLDRLKCSEQSSPWMSRRTCLCSFPKVSATIREVVFGIPPTITTRFLSDIFGFLSVHGITSFDFSFCWLFIGVSVIYYRYIFS